jgi:hypothetical protein
MGTLSATRASVASFTTEAEIYAATTLFIDISISL